jgi:hypothetical protein
MLELRKDRNDRLLLGFLLLEVQKEAFAKL